MIRSAAETSIPFSEDEMEIARTRFYMGENLNVYTTPITPKENFKRMFTPEGPLWQAAISDFHYLFPQCVPDNPAKGNVSDAKLSAAELGGKDMFGIEWEYVEAVGGSTVRPGNPLLADANEWYDKIVFPTKEVIDSWDWEGCHERANIEEERDFFWEPVICTGWYERLISFMDFMNAAMAMIDDDQKPAVNDLFDHLSDLYIMLIDKYCEVFPGIIDCVCLHDDWGHKTAPFFSIATVREMIVPHMRKVTDHIHALGMLAEVHSCGKTDMLVPAYIEAGFDLHECQPLLDFDTVIPEYSDRLVFHVPPEVPEPDAPEEAHRAAARAYVDQVMKWGRPAMLETYYAAHPIQPVFWEELYRYSRQRFAE